MTCEHSMQQDIHYIKERLKRRKEQYVRQQIRCTELKQIMQHTVDDIEQMEYALHELEKAQQGERKQIIIPNERISDFFTHLSDLFDALQHRYQKHFNYRLTCLVIYARYKFESRIHIIGRKYLTAMTILTYFKSERNMIGSTICHIYPSQ